MYDDIRNQFIPKYIELNRNILEICDSENLLIPSLLDPLSYNLPLKVFNNWKSQNAPEDRQN